MHSVDRSRSLSESYKDVEKENKHNQKNEVQNTSIGVCKEVDKEKHL